MPRIAGTLKLKLGFAITSLERWRHPPKKIHDGRFDVGEAAGIDAVKDVLNVNFLLLRSCFLDQPLDMPTRLIEVVLRASFSLAPQTTGCSSAIGRPS